MIFALNLHARLPSSNLRDPTDWCTSDVDTYRRDNSAHERPSDRNVLATHWASRITVKSKVQIGVNHDGIGTATS